MLWTARRRTTPVAALAGGGTPQSIAFVAAADGSNTTGTSHTFSYTTGSGSHRLLVVGVAGDLTSDFVTGATYASTPMTLAQKLAPVGGANRWAYLFWLLNPASGANNVVISASSSTFLAGIAADYTGVKQSGQPDATTTQQGVGSINTLTTSITTVADNSWAILLEDSFQSSNPPAASTGATRRTFDAAFGVIGLFDSNGPIHPAGSYSMTTLRNAAINSIDHIVASFSPG